MAGELLYLLISGDVLYVGLGLVAVGVVVVAWHRNLGGWFSVGGVVLAVVSAVPIHPVAYAILALSTASFGRIQREACKDYGVTLVPRSVLARALTLPGNATDGLHLSAQGHAWLAARVSEMWL